MLRKLVMYLSAFLPMFLIMWIKEILLGIRNVLENHGSIPGKVFI